MLDYFIYTKNYDHKGTSIRRDTWSKNRVQVCQSFTPHPTLSVSRVDVVGPESRYYYYVRIRRYMVSHWLVMYY